MKTGKMRSKTSREGTETRKKESRQVALKSTMINSYPICFIQYTQLISTNGPLAVYSVCALKKNLVFKHSPGSVNTKTKKVARTKPHNIILTNQYHGAYSNQSQGRGEKKRVNRCGCVRVVALAMSVREFKERALGPCGSLPGAIFLVKKC